MRPIRLAAVIERVNCSGHDPFVITLDGTLLDSGRDELEKFREGEEGGDGRRTARHKRRHSRFVADSSAFQGGSDRRSVDKKKKIRLCSEGSCFQDESGFWVIKPFDHTSRCCVGDFDAGCAVCAKMERQIRVMVVKTRVVMEMEMGNGIKSGWEE